MSEGPSIMSSFRGDRTADREKMKSAIEGSSLNRSVHSFRPQTLDVSYKTPNTSLADFSGALPRTFDVDSVPKVKDEKCNLCSDKYRKLTDLRLGGSKANNCTKCGISVCDKCSANKAQLSQRDETKYKVCNKCHSTMQNAPLISFY